MSESPYALALAAGMLATVNPCGFALLPTYLALLITDPATITTPEVGGPGARPLGRVLGRGLIVTPLALSVERYLLRLTILIGVALAGLGGWLLAGREVYLATPKLRTGKPTRTLPR